MGIDTMMSYKFDEKSVGVEEFVNEILIEQIGAKTIVIGEENSNLDVIKNIGAAAKIEIIVVDAVKYQNQTITTKLALDAFMKCKFDDYENICGRPFLMIGVVEHGKALGRTVGMPTANLGVPDNKLKPENGVYATITDVDGELYKGLTNIGPRPSVDDMPHVTIETFLLEFSKDIYDKEILMEVHRYIRGVTKFNSLEEVQKQVQKDIEEVKTYLDNSVSKAI